MRTKKLPAAMREKVGFQICLADCSEEITEKQIYWCCAYKQVKDYFYLQSSNGKLHNEEGMKR